MRTKPLSPRPGRIALAVVAALAAVGARAPGAWARAYTLPELLEAVRRQNPGLAASVQATQGIEAQLLEANRGWLPQGEFLSMLAPVPDIRCETDLPVPAGVDAKQWRQQHCDRTNISEASINLKGVFTRTELRLVQPVFTFGKISAGVSAAQAGVAASRSREAGVAADLAFNVKRAYYGAKLAREVLATLEEARGYLDEGQQKVDKDLAAGTGTVTVIDRHRLRTLRAELETRVLEAKKLADVARGGIRALLGPESPPDVEVDAEELAAVEVPVRTLAQYEDQARLSRPEVRALDQLVASKRALADLERRKQYPDVVLLGTATFAFASSIDNPKNAFANDPFNTLSAGLAAAVRLPLDLGVRNARALKLHAEAEESVHRRREALGGIGFEVQRAYSDLVEAQQRKRAVDDGVKAARAWLTAVHQNFAAGLAEAKDFADALVAFFQNRVKGLQSIYDLNLAAAALARASGAEVAR